MLVLTRQSGESIMIGDDIKITVLKISGSQVRVGVLAPKDVVVHREEVYERVQDEKSFAASPESLEDIVIEIADTAGSLVKPAEDRKE